MGALETAIPNNITKIKFKKSDKKKARLSHNPSYTQSNNITGSYVYLISL